MSRALIRRSAGLWLAVTVAVAAWLVAGPSLTAGAFIVTACCLLGQRLRNVRRSSQPSGGLRYDLLTVLLAGISWGLAGVAILTAPAEPVIHAARDVHTVAGAISHTHVDTVWVTAIRLLVGGGLISSLFVVRALRRPQQLVGQRSPAALDRARAIVAEHGEDSLSPFILRPDKCFEFAEDAVVAYAVIAETVVVSGGPVGPQSSAAEALALLVRRAHRAGLRVAAYGASEDHLAAFRQLGLRALRVGEEAVVDPCTFTLEGRPVRKLRQSVHRVERRGWRITTHEGRSIDAELERAIDAVEAEWRTGRDRMLGFAMGMGEFELGIRPDDIYVLAWSPEQRLQGVMRFLAHRGKLSLDTMRRVGETPNGLNEALVCHALEFARARGVREVSLNYAGLGHLVRSDAPKNRWGKWIARVLLTPLRGRFQMHRLVLFNQKFSPTWRPRYLMYESLATLPQTASRVLEAEGYLARRRPGKSADRPVLGRARPNTPLGDGVGR